MSVIPGVLLALPIMPLPVHARPRGWVLSFSSQRIFSRRRSRSRGVCWRGGSGGGSSGPGRSAT
eukprot:13088910-Alexandrium_andersonii.AAC.1